jgi:hypothetical protein
MISTATLKLVVDQVERILCCDEANRCEKDHLSFALAHLREAGKESEEGSGRSAARLQDDLWEEKRRWADQGLKAAWSSAGWPEDLSAPAGKKGVAA